MLFEGNVKQYTRSLYPLAVLLMAVPIVDLALRQFPPQFDALQWRFTTVGLLIGNLGTLLLGFGLAGLIAAISDHPKTLRVLGILGLVLAVLLVAVMGLFALDAVQIRRLANAPLKRPILLSSLAALTTATFGVVVLATAGRGALMASRGTPRTSSPSRNPSAPRRPAAAPLVVAGSSSQTEAV